METSRRASASRRESKATVSAGPASPPPPPRHRHPTPRGYDLCDWLSEGALYFMVLFGPWVFGSTEAWAVWVMNGASYVLGALLIVKWLLRWRAGYQPVRWGRPLDPSPGLESRPPDSRPRALTVALAVLTVTMLGYCLVSALNAHYTYHYDRRWFDPHPFIAWLPHSYDSSSTWFAFWQYLGLAFVFWAVRDWLLGKSRNERRNAGPTPSSLLPSPAAGPRLPSRLRRLLWVVCLNGGVLAMESILQRLSGTNKLLWLVEPWRNVTAETQFGPYAYRANAAEYLNLVWPVCLGFWWTLRRLARDSRGRPARMGANPHVILLPCAVLMAAGPIISTTRGGAAIAALGLLLAVALLLTDRHGTWLHRAGIASLFLVIVTFAGYLGWQELEARLKTVFADDLSGRVEIYKNAELMARDFVWLGSGPNTFTPLYQEYRSQPTQTWAAWAHDDWLEFRITFGRIGASGLLAMLCLVFVKWFRPGGFHLPRTAVRMIWLALAGCLVHARFDFPLHVYSVLFVFILWSALLFCVSRKA